MRALTWCEVEEGGVEVQRREGPRGDDDRLEALEDRLDGQRRVQTRQLQHWGGGSEASQRLELGVKARVSLALRTTARLDAGEAKVEAISCQVLEVQAAHLVILAADGPG